MVSPVDVLAGSGSKDALLTVGCKNNVFFVVRPPDVGGAKASVAWRLEKNAPYVPTPVSDGKTLYVLSDGGVLQALEASSGELRWQERLPGNFHGSPLLIGGKLYCASREDEVFVAEVGGKFKLLATSGLHPGEEGRLRRRHSRGRPQQPLRAHRGADGLLSRAQSLGFVKRLVIGAVPIFMVTAVWS